MYTIRRDEYGHAVAIERDGYTVLHLQPGTERNEQEVEGIVWELNESVRLRAALEDIRDHAIRFGLATIHLKAEKALSATSEPTCFTCGINVQDTCPIGQSTGGLPCEPTGAELEIYVVRNSNKDILYVGLDWNEVERLLAQDASLEYLSYRINATEGDENDA